MKQIITVIVLTLILTVSFTVSAQMEIKQARGKLTMLRVHDLGTKFGPSRDQIDVEVVIKLDSQPDMAFGFQLRNDRNFPAHKQILDLLRQAFNNNLYVFIYYKIKQDRKNGVIISAWLPPPEAIVIEVPNIVDIAEDPAAKPGRLDPSVLDEVPPPPPEFKDKGAPELMKEIQWLPLIEINLGPGESHNVTVSLTKPVLLLARAEWNGSVTPVKIFVEKDGTTLATGESYHIAPKQGSVIAYVEIHSMGDVIVLITNMDSVPTNVQLIVGTLPIS